MNPCKKTYKKKRTRRFIFLVDAAMDCIFPYALSLYGSLSLRKVQTSFHLFSPTDVPNPLRVLVRLSLQNKKPHTAVYYFGGRAGTRTLDPLIKSQLLYQLSYASRTEFLIRTGVIIDFFLVNASLYHNYVATNAISYALYHQLSAHLPMS